MANRKASRESIERLLENVGVRATESQRSGDSRLAAHLFGIRAQRAVDLGEIDTAIRSYEAAAKNARQAQNLDDAEGYSSAATELKTQKRLTDQAERDAAQEAERRRASRANARDARRRTREAEMSEFEGLKERRFKLNTYISMDSMRIKLGAAATTLMSALDIYVSVKLGGILEYAALAPSLAITALAGYVTGVYSTQAIGMKRALAGLSASMDARAESHTMTKEDAGVSSERDSKIVNLESLIPRIKESINGDKLRLKLHSGATAAMVVLDAYIASKLGGIVEGVALVPALAVTGATGFAAGCYGWFATESRIHLAEAAARLTDLKENHAQNADVNIAEVKLLKR